MAAQDVITALDEAVGESGMTKQGVVNALQVLLDETEANADDAATEAAAYTPGNGAHWTNPDPTTVAGALDRLAAAVYAGTSGTIA